MKKTEVKEKTDLHVSLMPPGLTLGLKPEEFADLLAYLHHMADRKVQVPIAK